MKDEKYVIWSDIDLDIKKWECDIKEEFPEAGANEAEMYDLMYEINRRSLEDARSRLNIETPRGILVIADLGLWNGRRGAWGDVKGGNIRDCLYSECDFNEWYIDRLGDFCSREVHHDGTNYLTYRAYKDEATATQIENLRSKLDNGTATRRDITRVTRRLGDEVASAYGLRR